MKTIVVAIVLLGLLALVCAEETKEKDHNKYGWDNYGYSDTDSYSRDRRRYKEGELRDSYHKDGHSSYGLDKYEKRGYGKDSYKHIYDKDGYDQDGYDKHGYNRAGVYRQPAAAAVSAQQPTDVNAQQPTVSAQQP